MFSKPIFKQTLKSNWKLWLIFTGIMCGMSALMIMIYNPAIMNNIKNMADNLIGTAGSSIADKYKPMLDNMTSLLGTISTSFYGNLALILPLIYIIITANGLVASQVDKGSMAYILSTPVKRKTVVATQGAYLITAVLCMFLIVTGVGLATVQLKHGSAFGTAYTEDVKAAARILKMDNAAVAGDLKVILANDEALKRGARVRAMEEDVYRIYLGQKIASAAFQAAADTLGKDLSEVRDNPALIKSDEGALAAGAQVMGMSPAAYAAYLDQEIARMSMPTEQAQEMQNKILAGMSAAAEVLNTDVATLASNMKRLKGSEAALNAAADASGMPKEYVIGIVNTQLAAEQVSLDEGIGFSVKDFLVLNLGVFLLMFAISSISFLCSCVFNLSKNSMALGAGIPIAFYLFHTLARLGDNLENFKYLSLNTLYDPQAIISGGSVWIQFTVFAVIGIVLYAISVKVFKEKDLPL